MHHTPRRRFGQHFLVDEALIGDIVSAIAPRRSDRMVEIGPGLGALTRPLLACVDHLHAVEIDRDIAAGLRRAFPAERLTVHEADALAFDFAALGPALRVVGNLPYNISTPLLFHLAESCSAIYDMHLMLQKEVVERMTALPGEPEYGRLSVMLQFRFRIDYVLSATARAFRPAPQVESAVVRMVPHTQRLPCDELLLSEIVKTAFMQRRKTLRNALRPYLTEPDFDALHIDAGARAQELGVADFVRITNYVAARERQ